MTPFPWPDGAGDGSVNCPVLYKFDSGFMIPALPI